MPRSRRIRRAAAVLVALTLAACGGGGGGDEDDRADASTDEAADATTEPAADGPAPGVDPATGDGASPGLGGAVRSLPGLVDHADLPLAAFLQEVFGFPGAVPVPELELARAYTEAVGLGTPTASRTYGADYVAPAGGVDEAFAAIEDALDPATWSSSGEVDEVSDGVFARTWTASGPDVASARVTFQEASGRVLVAVGSPSGVADVAPPVALWPWADEVPVADGARPVSWLVQVPDSGGGPAAQLDRRWRGPVGAYDALADWVAGLPAGVLTPGEVTTETAPVAETGRAVTADDGFAGSLSVVLSDAAAGPTVVLTGRLPLDG